MLLINRNEIIIKYQVTEGQINYAVTRKVFPKRAFVKKHNEVFYNASEIEQYFIDNPVKPSKRSTPKIRDRRNIFTSNIPGDKQTKENQRLAEFNKLVVTFNIQNRNIKKRKIAMHSLHNKYKPIERKVVALNDVHEHAEIRDIDSFAQIHDSNHRIVI